LTLNAPFPLQGSVKKEGDDKTEAKGEDEDAINSDLDSSDDELDEELAGGGDNGGDIVIALYEKVCNLTAAPLQRARIDTDCRSAGTTSQEQVEGNAQRWFNFCQRKRLPFQ